ncbi:hypothetical protein KUTeg_009705 [Tegillarca granosa]|uniref:Uncharacterized protein n=1 Tax=Tegillarca granosa TaxID=220873 RepID=A0ABQ9F7S7_TEGGR|nr:hypothetical protein KUTeg_009705 [Tegillarca granosa]
MFEQKQKENTDLINYNAKVTKKVQPEDNEISLEDIEEYEVSPWRSPLTMKLAVVFMFTQMTVNLFYESRGISFSSFYPFSILEQYYPKDLVFGRIIQLSEKNHLKY